MPWVEGGVCPSSAPAPVPQKGGQDSQHGPRVLQCQAGVSQRASEPGLEPRTLQALSQVSPKPRARRAPGGEHLARILLCSYPPELREATCPSLQPLQGALPRVSTRCHSVVSNDRSSPIPEGRLLLDLNAFLFSASGTNVPKSPVSGILAFLMNGLPSFLPAPASRVNSPVCGGAAPGVQVPGRAGGQPGPRDFLGCRLRSRVAGPASPGCCLSPVRAFSQLPRDTCPSHCVTFQSADPRVSHLSVPRATQESMRRVDSAWG